MSQAGQEFKTSVDFNQNELRNATFQRLLVPPLIPVQGQIYYNTPIEVPFYWNTNKWLPFGLPPVHIRYADESAMITNQAMQIKGYIYYDITLDIYYEYLGTTVEDITDYNPIGGSGIYVPKITSLTFNTENGLIGGATQDLSTDRTWTFGLTGQALALHNLNTNGYIVRTAVDTIVSREIIAGDGISITNGDAVLGNTLINSTGVLSIFSDCGNSPITNDTDIYAVIDITSGPYTGSNGPQNITTLCGALGDWYADYQLANPDFTGNLYIATTFNEGYLQYVRIITGEISQTGFNGWYNTAGTATTPPTNWNSVDWVAPTDILLLSFVNESNAVYHESTVALTGQPTASYTTQHAEFLTTISLFTNFAGVLYPVVNTTFNANNSFLLHAFSVLNNNETVISSDLVVSLGPNYTAVFDGFSQANPYHPSLGLWAHSWFGVLDKGLDAGGLLNFTAQDFANDLNAILNGNNIQSVSLIDSYTNQILKLRGLTSSDIAFEVGLTGCINMSIQPSNIGALALNQTTPQTVINGVPLLDVPLTAFNNQKQFINKDYVDNEFALYTTLATDQTITGQKTFDNEFLSLVGYNPILRIKATSNQSTLNFRNFTNEDQAGIILDTSSSKLSIITRTDNSDIEIEPHGTGSIILPNVAIGTPVSNLGLDVNNKVVKGAGGSGVTQTTSSWTPTLIDAGGGATYNISTNNRTFYVKTGRMVHVCIGMTGISTSGTPTGQLQITGLPFTASSNNFILSKIGAIYGSDLPASDAEKVVVLLAPSSTTLVFRADNNVSTNNLNAVTFTSGSLYISFSYITN